MLELDFVIYEDAAAMFSHSEILDMKNNKNYGLQKSFKTCYYAKKLK